MTKKTLKSYAVNLIAVMLLYGTMVVLSESGVLNKYYSGILVLVCINIMLAVSLNLTTGCLGQIALWLAGFMSIGAYTAALFTKWLAVSGAGGYLGYFGGLILGGLLAA